MTLQALEGLEQAISELENATANLEVSLQGAQRDMFPETKRAVVKSLDAMIDHVETLVEEKRAS